MLMSSQAPQFIAGDFAYEIINETTVRVTCGDFFDVCVPIRDLDRGIVRYQRVRAEYFAKRADVLPIKGRRKAHAAMP